MNLGDAFKGRNLIAFIGAVVLFVLCIIFGIPKIFALIVGYLCGVYHKTFADWIQINILDRIKEW